MSIRYICENKQALVDHLKNDAKRLRERAAPMPLKSSKRRELYAEAWGIEQSADFVESCFLRDISEIEATISEQG